MICNICNLNNKKVIEIIESELVKTDGGMLSTSFRSQLCQDFPELTEKINKIESKDCEMHFNFHQLIKRETPILFEQKQEEEKSSSLAADISKDEASTLYELLESQMATFTALSNKVNGAISDHSDDMTTMIIHPNTMQFYKDLADSMRNTVKEISELNISLNGKKDGSLENFKAFVQVISEGKKNTEKGDLTTKDFDD